MPKITKQELVNITKKAFLRALADENYQRGYRKGYADGYRIGHIDGMLAEVDKLGLRLKNMNIAEKLEEKE